MLVYKIKETQHKRDKAVCVHKPWGLRIGNKSTTGGKNIATAEARIKTARRASYSLMGAGLCGIGGPEVGRHLWQVFILSRLTCGLDALAQEAEAVNKMMGSMGSTWARCA